MDAEKAKMGANELLSSSSQPFYEDEVGGSFTGKKYGEFCLHSGHPEQGSLSLFILHGKYLINLAITGKDPLELKILDTWADAVMKKVKAFEGDVAAP